jgi:predicted NUDIX family NTP pyrophosphohydrolase
MHLLAWGFNVGLARRYRDHRAIRAAATGRKMAKEVAVTTDKSGRTSAGILLWRRRNHRLEVLLAHQGGPYWVNKDLGHWTIPKGEVEEGEELVAVARREFAEETGHELPDTPFVELGEIRQKSGKLVLAWAAQGDLDVATAVSNTYQLEWPPGSGRVETFPEIDRVEWFRLNKARRKLKAAQVPFLDRLQAVIAVDR